ncbi:glycoside hydrolase N-terminal domain-containing protein [Rapidithrix thailandica]|uniref:Glycoside hydrolase N-terminal domain-containing protein n=1 Tax=Rapidithrix thailandica TaxID=413964 RepID=A0AAW9SAV9_9BACT
MKSTVTFTSLVFLILGCLGSLIGCKEKPEGQALQHQEPLRLWYTRPAQDWMQEALPLGNGYMGAMFFGGMEEEHIQFAEESLWAGGPGSHDKYKFGIRNGAHQNLPKVRALLKAGKLEEAHRLANQELTGEIHKSEENPTSFGDYGAHQTMGDLYISVKQEGEIQNYQRALDLNEGVATVTYQAGDVHYQRKFFGNYPKRVMVYHFESDAPEGTDYRIRLESPHQKLSEKFENNTYRWEGQLPGNNLRFETCYRVLTDKGIVSFEKGAVLVKGGSSITIIHTASTEYQASYPDYRGRDYKALNQQTLAKVEGLTSIALYKEHQQDYQSLFHRVTLNLGGHSRDSLPTDQRQKTYYEGTSDPGLEALYFQYGRYLMISASRPGTMPMNLQGKWNHSVDPPWACDYHMNINQQMIYWPAEVANLSECHEPLFDYMKSLVAPGQVAAKEFFNTRGWIVNTMNNAYGFTAPGWSFPWGFFPGGAAWLCQHTWEHYAFTQDTVYLQHTAYPLMKEAALFWMDYLTEDENGQLVSFPSYSPEHGGISTGASMDHQMAWDLLNNCIRAAEILNTDEKFREEAKQVRDRICPPMIGKWGQLQEWKEDVDDPDNHHRHVSHLFALYPGHQISVTKTPQLAEAAKVSLNARGDDGTGWSLAWKVSFWARLRDGDRAYKLFKRVLKPIVEKGYNMTDGGGSYANLLCAHPPFQIDGNMGSTAGIAEMLLQSHAGVLDILPALPGVWAQGSVKGLKARGGYTVDITWDNGTLKQVRILANRPGACTVNHGEKKITLNFQKGETKTLDASEFE